MESSAALNSVRQRPRIVLLCHHDSQVALKVLIRWIPSFADLVGLVIIREPERAMKWARARKELRRSGMLGFLDMLAFRIYYRIFLAAKDERRVSELIRHLQDHYPQSLVSPPTIEVQTPNHPDVVKFLTSVEADFSIAYCKHLLKKDVFSVPRHGTFVLHPGKCPEYRNSHGCFWALANGEPEKVVLSLLRVDEGVDTGPVFGYFTSSFDACAESHVIIQHRVLLDNLEALADAFREIFAAERVPLLLKDLPSASWGQPRLSNYLRYRKRYAKDGRNC